MRENRQFHKFIIITIIVPSAHDSVIGRENALGGLVRSPSSSSCCPADLHALNGFVTVRASCSTPNSSQAWTSASKSDRWLRWFMLQTLTQDFPPKRVDQAAGFSAHLQCRRSPCPRLSIVNKLMPAAASCATPPVPKKRKRSNARSKTRTT